MCEDHKKDRKGRSIDNPEDHQLDHQKWKRRDFLQSAGLFTAGLTATFSGIPLYAMGTSTLLAPLNNLETDRVLVLIQLRGGNDGLNTVINRFDNTYYNIRPNIAVKEQNLWALNSKTGMPNRMLDLKPMWEENKMKIIQNVGYPDPNYSHFRSSDIWATSSDTEEFVNTGWIGRYFDQDLPAFIDAQPTIPPAMQIGVQTDLIFQGDRANLALAISSPQEFYKLAITGQLYDLKSLTNTPKDQELFYVRQVANSAFRYSQSISAAYNRGRNEVNYPDSNLAQQLAIVSRLIKGRLGTKVYMVYIDGFDTHAEQYDKHLALLNTISTSVSAFYKDLEKQQMDDKVLGMTFSEFGRTIGENGSIGTDHGTGAPMLMFCKGIGKDIVGTPPDLVNLGEYGDPNYGIDFRDVYASLLQNWFGMEAEISDYIIGKDRSPIPNLVPVKNPAIGSEEFGALLGHKLSTENPENLQILFAMLHDGPVVLDILDRSGQVIRPIINEFRTKGTHTVSINTKKYALNKGEYQYRLKTGGKIYQRLLLITK
ncbi:MAG: DUF1501 domain-containing protein [Saprospiraceae bacterium]|nr:DUF1501 domain-containing protein [Saprospiraceae bacterium]